MNTRSYRVTGMTCQGCTSTVTALLKEVSGITGAKVTFNPPRAELMMENSLTISLLNESLTGKYQLMEEVENTETIENKGFLQTYKPILLIAAYITGFIFLRQLSLGNLNLFNFMNDFMAGFFLVFSFFKLLDIKGFANSYAMYDIIAKHFKAYAYAYPFIELALGVAYFTGYNPLYTNAATVLIMSVSSIGVLQKAFKGEQIQCACLGIIFNLPVSTVTIIEDLLMLAMSIGMLRMLTN